jgi:hypothetical protein
MIVLWDRQAAVRGNRAPLPLVPEPRSLVLGLAAAPARTMESPWPRWLDSFENASRSAARTDHRRSRRTE